MQLIRGVDKGTTQTIKHIKNCKLKAPIKTERTKNSMRV